jgi:hypothetical protein
MPDESTKQGRYAHRNSLKAREIGELRHVVNPERKAAFRFDLAGWLRAYMPHSFFRPFSPDQLEAIRRIQVAMLQGGTSAIGMPRGTGKTTIVEGAVIWATLNGHKRFPVIIGADMTAAAGIIRDLKTEFETNAQLAEDYPEVVQAVEHLEGAPQKAGSQTWDGQQTRIVWRADKLVFPSHPSSAVSGACIVARGITGGVRGLKHKTGKSDIRPDFVLLDDPQTRESAGSPAQTSEREKIIMGDVLALAGHDRKISAVMCVTVICKGDLADRFLDTDKRPEWQGLKTKLVYSFGTNEKLWEQYAEAWRDGQAAGTGTDTATAFYVTNQAALDEGWNIASPELYDRDKEASAIQHAYNLFLQVGEFAFRAEYQNDPADDQTQLYDLTPDIVMSRTVDRRQFEVPEDMPVLAAFTDINNRGLHWALVAFKDGHTGHVVSYGRHPERGELVPENASNTERNKLVFAGLGVLARHLESMQLRRADQLAKIDAMGIDAGSATDTVYEFARVTRAQFRLIPSRGFSASRYMPMPSKTIGTAREQCHMQDGQTAAFLAHNADYWREIAQRAFIADAGAPGSLTLFGGKPLSHRMFAEHVCNERLIDKAIGEKYSLYKWQHLPGWNDWLDALVGCFAVAAFQGLTTTGRPSVMPQRRRVQRTADAFR